MNTYQFWKKLAGQEEKLANPPKRFYCVRKGVDFRISEIYCIYDLAQHIKEKIYTISEVLTEMEKDKKLREGNNTL